MHFHLDLDSYFIWLYVTYLAVIWTQFLKMEWLILNFSEKKKKLWKIYCINANEKYLRYERVRTERVPVSFSVTVSDTYLFRFWKVTEKRKEGGRRVLRKVYTGKETWHLRSRSWALSLSCLKSLKWHLWLTARRRYVQVLLLGPSLLLLYSFSSLFPFTFIKKTESVISKGNCSLWSVRGLCSIRI